MSGTIGEQFQPPQDSGSLDALTGFGEGLLDPESEMSKRWMEQLRQGIGDSTDAAQRAAGYQAAQGGFGGGASPELLAMQRDIGVGGREAEGRAATDFMLRAPQMGVGALSAGVGFETQRRGQDISGETAWRGQTLGAESQRRGQDLQSRLAEQDNQRMIDQINQGNQLQYDQLAQDRYMRELMMQYGG